MRKSMIALWEARTDKELSAEPVLNVIDRDTRQPMNQSNANFTFCHRPLTLSSKRGNHSGALRSEHGPASPIPASGYHCPKIAVCSRVPLDSA